MKKVIAVLMLAVLVISLSGCGEEPIEKYLEISDVSYSLKHNNHNNIPFSAKMKTKTNIKIEVVYVECTLYYVPTNSGLEKARITLPLGEEEEIEGYNKEKTYTFDMRLGNIVYGDLVGIDIDAVSIFYMENGKNKLTEKKFKNLSNKIKVVEKS